MEKEGGSHDKMGRLSCLPSTVLQKLVASQTVLSRPLACRHLPCRHPQDLSASTQDALGVHPQIYPNRQMSQSELKTPPPAPSCSTHSLFADEKTEASRSLQAARPGGTGSSTTNLLLLPALQFNPELGRDLPTTPNPVPLAAYSHTTHTIGIAGATWGLGRAVAGTYLQLS